MRSPRAVSRVFDGRGSPEDVPTTGEVGVGVTTSDLTGELGFTVRLGEGFSSSVSYCDFGACGDSRGAGEGLPMAVAKGHELSMGNMELGVEAVSDVLVELVAGVEAGVSRGRFTRCSVGSLSLSVSLIQITFARSG